MMRLLLFLLAIQVSACSFLPKSPPVAFDPDANQERVLKQQHWQASGRILIRKPEDSWQARLDWRHHADHDQLQFATALGGVVFVLERHGEMVSVTDDSGVTEIGTSGQVLTRYGFLVPIESLGFWVRGLPDPKSPFKNPSFETGWMTGFQQSGWKIEYDRYDQINGLWLPHRVSLMHENLLLKYVVDNWD